MDLPSGRFRQLSALPFFGAVVFDAACYGAVAVPSSPDVARWLALHLLHGCPPVWQLPFGGPGCRFAPLWRALVESRESRAGRL